MTDPITITLADGDSADAIIGMLEGYTVNMPAAIQYAGTETVVIAHTSNSGITVYDADAEGGPITNSSYLIPWSEFDNNNRIEIV